MTSHACPPPTQSPQVDVCVGFIGWGEIKSGLVLKGEGVRLPLHNATVYGANPGQGLNLASLFC
jgi:hypothetical protein